MNKNIIIVILVIIILGLGGYLVYDKVLTKDDLDQNNIKNEVDAEKNNDLDDEEITIEELIGTYTWEKNYINEHGNEMNLKITLLLNSDGTATYDANSQYEHEATKGSYVYENGKIIYTREYYNYKDQNNNPYEDENNKNETFIVIDKNTLQNTYYSQITSLKK